MSFKDISYLELWQPFCCGAVCNFGGRGYEEHFCAIILILDQCFKWRYRLKIFHIYRSGGPFIWWGGTICAILVEGIMKNI